MAAGGEGGERAKSTAELAALRREFVLGVEGEKVLRRPKIAMLAEDNVRQGFFEFEQFTAVRAKLPEPLRPMVTFAYNHRLAHQQRGADPPVAAGRLRRRPGAAGARHDEEQEGEGVPLHPRAARAARRAARPHRRVQKRRGAIVPHVFHRNGEPIRWFYDSWRSACKEAGLAGRIPHDFRRSSVRNSVRAGIPERVAMTMTGNQTRSVFERYNIVSDGDLDDAAHRLDDATVTETVTISPRRVGARARK